MMFHFENAIVRTQTLTQSGRSYDRIILHLDRKNSFKRCNLCIETAFLRSQNPHFLRS